MEVFLSQIFPFVAVVGCTTTLSQALQLGLTSGSLSLVKILSAVLIQRLVSVS